jgi:Proteolipid membrane potential modulator
MMLTGVGHDTLINSLLFLAGVLPSHVHGFYVSCTWFHRRKKARRGRYPGGPAGLIHSKDLLNGGLSSAEVEKRWRTENGVKSRRKEDGYGHTRTRPTSMRESNRGVAARYQQISTEPNPQQLPRRRESSARRRYSQPRPQSLRSSRGIAHDVRRERVFSEFETDMGPPLPPRRLV